jgi:hypothetical protein
VFRALRHRTDVGHINEGAVAAILAVKNQDFG